MNHQLSNKEKKTKRAEARGRAILWSEKELRNRQVNSVKNRTQSKPLTEQASVSTPDTDIILKQNSKPNEGTVSSLRQTIKDLKIQRQELDITIKVLSRHLESLNQQVSKPSKRSKSDGY